MIKGIILKALFIGFAAVLIVGAINRTSAINEKVRGNDDDHEVTEMVGANLRTAGGVRNEENNPSALDWQSYQGVVTDASETGMAIETTDGTQIHVEGRPWLYLEEQDFTVAVGDRLSLTAFYETGEYKVGTMVNLENGHSVQVRDSAGTPAWRGRGRGQN